MSGYRLMLFFVIVYFLLLCIFCYFSIASLSQNKVRLWRQKHVGTATYTFQWLSLVKIWFVIHYILSFLYCIVSYFSCLVRLKATIRFCVFSLFKAIQLCIIPYILFIWNLMNRSLIYGTIFLYNESSFFCKMHIDTFLIN